MAKLKKLETFLVEIMEYNNGLCMDVSSERHRLARAIVKGLGNYASESFEIFNVLKGGK